MEIEKISWSREPDWELSANLAKGFRGINGGFPLNSGPASRRIWIRASLDCALSHPLLCSFSYDPLP